MENKTFDELMVIVNELLSANPHCMLSGSIALKQQGVPIRRECHDIDIYVPYSMKFKRIEGIKVDPNDNSEFYDMEDYRVEFLIYKDVNVNVFNPESESLPELNSYPLGKLGMVDKMDIIQFKMKHAFGEHWSRFKHKDDLIHILVNI